MDTLEFHRVTTSDEVALLARTADEVWHEFFPSILSAGQIDYMVARFQSAEAVTDQLAHKGYEYYLLRTPDGATAGYVGVQPEAERLFLSKLYLLKPFRGRGYASEAFRFLERLCRGRGLLSIWLTVNRHNAHTIAVYRARGFRVVREEKTDIGCGYVMDDYVMEWTLDDAAPSDSGKQF